MLGIIKGDIRYTYLKEMIDDAIISSDLHDFFNVDSLLLPLGGIGYDYIIKGSDLSILDILAIAKIKTIYTGEANDNLKSLCTRENIKLVELLRLEEFVLDNARLTAKACLYLMHEGDEEISDYKVLLMGYGNISFYLARLLKELNCSFEIYTENDIERKFCMLEGYKCINEIKKSYNIIINTIPKNIILDYNSIVDARIIDLASKPYGFDASEIVRRNIRYDILSMAPSKFAAKSAAKIIKKIIENNK